jgi:hypothetical protein
MHQGCCRTHLIGFALNGTLDEHQPALAIIKREQMHNLGEKRLFVEGKKKPPMWAGETATSYFPVELPLKYRES